MQYAAVLPLPVRARARTSWFSSARGIAFCWTRVGRENPRSAKARRMRGEMRWAKSANVTASSTISSRLCVVRRRRLLLHGENHHARDTTLSNLRRSVFSHAGFSACQAILYIVSFRYLHFYFCFGLVFSACQAISYALAHLSLTLLPPFRSRL